MPLGAVEKSSVAPEEGNLPKVKLWSWGWNTGYRQPTPELISNTYNVSLKSQHQPMLEAFITEKPRSSPWS